MRIGPIITLLLITLAASALWWLETLRHTEPVVTADPAERHAPEAYFVHFRARAWAAEGLPRHVTHGERMTRFTDDRSNEVEQPEIHYRDPVGPPWYVVSERGRVDADGDRIDLTGNVVATRGVDAPDPLILHTNALQIRLGTGRATTDDPVDVFTTGSRVHSVGMTATFDSGLVELHSNVRGHHDPASSTP